MPNDLVGKEFVLPSTWVQIYPYMDTTWPQCAYVQYLCEYSTPLQKIAEL